MHLPAALAGGDDAVEAFRWCWHVMLSVFRFSDPTAARPSGPSRDSARRISPPRSRCRARRGRRAACRARSICPPGSQSLLTSSRRRFSVLPERRHVRCIELAGIDDQRNEALRHALLPLVLQRRLALEVGLVPFDEPLEPALQHRVVGRQILLPGAVALFEAQRIQREHAEGFQTVLLPGGPDGIENLRRVADVAVDLPAELAGEGHADELTPASGDLSRLVRQPRQRKVGAADIGQNVPRLRPGKDLAGQALGCVFQSQFRALRQVLLKPLEVVQLRYRRRDQHETVLLDRHDRHFGDDAALLVCESSRARSCPASARCR